MSTHWTISEEISEEIVRPFTVHTVVGAVSSLVSCKVRDILCIREIGHPLDGSELSPKRSSWERIHLLPRRGRAGYAGAWETFRFGQDGSSMKNETLKRRKPLIKVNRTKLNVCVFLFVDVNLIDIYISTALRE